MAVWLEDIVEAAAKHDLAGLGADRVEVPRTDAFAVDRRPLSSGKKPPVNFIERQLLVDQCFVSDWS